MRGTKTRSAGGARGPESTGKGAALGHVTGDPGHVTNMIVREAVRGLPRRLKAEGDGLHSTGTSLLRDLNIFPRYSIKPCRVIMSRVIIIVSKKLPPKVLFMSGSLT